MGCECEDTADFVPLKIPTDFDKKIQFANLDVPTELTLHRRGSRNAAASFSCHPAAQPPGCPATRALSSLGGARGGAHWRPSLQFNSVCP